MSCERPAEGRLASRKIYRGRTIELTIERVRLPNGREMDFEKIHHRGATAVVPLLPNGDVVLIRQYRYATGGWLLEVPAGTRDGCEPPESCARREIEEEAGYRVGEAGELVPLGWIWTTPGFTDEKIWLFLATGLEPVPQRLEEDELIEVETLPLAEAARRAARGEIEDAKSVCALLRAAAHLGVG